MGSETGAATTTRGVAAPVITRLLPACWSPICSKQTVLIVPTLQSSHGLAWPRCCVEPPGPSMPLDPYRPGTRVQVPKRKGSARTLRKPPGRGKQGAGERDLDEVARGEGDETRDQRLL